MHFQVLMSLWHSAVSRGRFRVNLSGPAAKGYLEVKVDLVVGFNSFETYYIVKLETFPKVRGENKEYLKPPPS